MKIPLCCLWDFWHRVRPNLYNYRQMVERTKRGLSRTPAIIETCTAVEAKTARGLYDLPVSLLKVITINFAEFFYRSGSRAVGPFFKPSLLGLPIGSLFVHPTRGTIRPPCLLLRHRTGSAQIDAKRGACVPFLVLCGRSSLTGTVLTDA